MSAKHFNKPRYQGLYQHLEDDIIKPPDNKTVWRYMSLDKYIDLLVRQELFLCRLDKLGDPWEGAWTQEMIAYHLNGEDKANHKNLLQSFTQDLRTKLFVSCWHLNEHESAAMWEIYSSKNAGVAIKTTVGNLINCFDSNFRFNTHGFKYIGQVSYVNFEESDSQIENKPKHYERNIINYALNKRKSFAHEAEVRIVEHNSNLEDKSYVRVDIPHLIENLYLSPLMDDGFVESIKQVSEKFGINPERIKKSPLHDPIIY